VGCSTSSETALHSELSDHHFAIVVITMGVHGLATYLRENIRALSTSLILSQEQAKSKPTLPLVVDGWSCVQLIDTPCNVIDNGSAALYTNSITNPVCRGYMVANFKSFVTL
jgi:hypothetical protein